MGDFLSWLASYGDILAVVALAVSFWATLVLARKKLYALAAVFGVLFVVALIFVAIGPLGTHFYERFTGKRQPMFKMPTTQQVDQLREKLRKERQ